MRKVQGYTSGVFDMFHIGHLNLLEAAAERCDYLTVAVASDRLATELKGHEPAVPFAERMEIVQSLRFVDQVVPQQDLDKMTAWNDHRFDTIFAGDNWQTSPRWVDTVNQLREVGVSVMFLPYTKTTSSERLEAARLSAAE